MRSPIVIMAGGTGGHIYPALAVAEELTRAEVAVHWLGGRAGLEQKLVTQAGYPLARLAVSGLRGRGVCALLSAPLMLTRAVWQAIICLRRIRPAAVLGMGGYVSGPGGLAAWLLRIPLLIFDNNAVLGFANRCLAPLAARRLEAFPNTYAGAGAVRTGNPVRAAIHQLVPLNYSPAHPLAGLKLLVIGGSQGARALNQFVPRFLAQTDLPLQVWHQTGANLYQETVSQYAATPEVRVQPYIEDMCAAYAWADVVLCRAGATTVAELCAAGRPAVLVPFPQAADDHQTANARYLTDAGAAVLMPQAQLNTMALEILLRGWLQRPDTLTRMAQCARALAVPDAAARVAAQCMELAYGRH